MHYTKLIAFLFILNTSLYSANYPILSYEEYAKTQYDVPYVFQITKQNQCVFYFGANHSCDPQNEQYPLLRKFWQEFMEKTGGENCIVLVEGSLRNLHGSKTAEEAICNGGGEGGFITFCANEKNIHIECPEPGNTLRSSFLREELLKQFPEDEVDYLDFAHWVQEFHRRRKNNPALEFETFYQEYAKRPPLEQMKAVHKKIFKTEFNSSDEFFYYSITNPVETATIINKVCRQASIIRDQHILAHIDKLLKRGNNIFVVYGFTHAVMQENVIKQMMVEGRM